MAQRTSGARAALSVPGIFELVQRALGGPRSRAAFIGRYVRPTPGDLVLDIGCGTATIRPDLGEVTYVGFDPSREYIEVAQQRLAPGDRAFVAGIEDVDPDDLGGPFDLVIAKGVLHHLDDDPARRVCDLAARALRPGGRFITFDGAFVEGQSRIARFLISRDRGANVRDPEGYCQLAREAFEDIQTHVRHDLLRFPYTHVMLECTTTSR